MADKPIEPEQPCFPTFIEPSPEGGEPAGSFHTLGPAGEAVEERIPSLKAWTELYKDSLCQPPEEDSDAHRVSSPDNTDDR